MNCLERTIDWGISQYAKHDFFSNSYKKTLLLTGIPVVGFIGLSFHYFRLAVTVATLAYGLFKLRNSLLYCGAHIGSVSLVKAMLYLGANINSTSISGLTSLHYAVARCHIEAIKVLLNQGADPNQEAHIKTAFDYPETPLNWIVDQGSLEGFKVFASHMKNQEIDYKILMGIAQKSDHQNSELIAFLKSS